MLRFALCCAAVGGSIVVGEACHSHTRRARPHARTRTTHRLCQVDKLREPNVTVQPQEAHTNRITRWTCLARLTLSSSRSPKTTAQLEPHHHIAPGFARSPPPPLTCHAISRLFLQQQAAPQACRPPLCFVNVCRVQASMACVCCACVVGARVLSLCPAAARQPNLPDCNPHTLLHLSYVAAHGCDTARYNAD